MRGVPDIGARVAAFWAAHRRKIKPWYLDARRPDDVVISASPEFLLAPMCRELGIGTLMASRVDAHTGAYDGENCHGAEKVRRFYEAYPANSVEKFYSDALSDAPMAEIAGEAFVVQGDARIPWAEYRPSTLQKLKKMFFSPEFFRFLVIGVVNTFNGVLFAWLYSDLLHLQENVAFVAGYLTSLLINYVLNSLYTFHEKLAFSRLWKFAVSYVPNFLIQNACVFVFFNLLGWPNLAAYIIAAVIGVPLTFLMMKVFTFKKRTGDLK